ncbi:MAG: photosynthetic reaction center cytochrome c subunit family protein, partial [Fimbriimonadaceae bacterium]
FLLGTAIIPFAVFSAQQNPAPTAEQVYKNIKVMNGVPASDLIPSMEFMAASMGYKCVDCHDAKDYAVDTPKIIEARKMILLQRDINKNHFGGKLEVTCMTCHGGKPDHPASTPIPNEIKLRHERLETTLKPDDLFAKHITGVGNGPVSVTRTGTLTAPDLVTHKSVTSPLEFVQTGLGKFRMTAVDRKVVFDGTQMMYGEYPIADEPAAIFGRIGRAWRGDQAFAGLERTTISGQDKIGKTSVIVVRGVRPATTSTEELYFDAKSGLLLRLVNIKRSSLGSVISSIDYSNYKAVSGWKVPMKVVATFADGEQWAMDFKSAKAE